MIAEADAAQGRGEEEKKVAEELRALQNPQSRVAHMRQLERELRIQADFQKRFPIPVRMPKAVKLDLSLPFDMELLNYTWGGKYSFLLQISEVTYFGRKRFLQSCMT